MSGPAIGEETRGQQSRESESRRDVGGIKFAYRYSKPDSLKEAINNALLVVGSLFLILAMYFFGHGYRVARAAALGRADPPKSVNVGRLFVGILFIVLGLIVEIMYPEFAWTSQGSDSSKHEEVGSVMEDGLRFLVLLVGGFGIGIGLLIAIRDVLPATVLEAVPPVVESIPVLALLYVVNAFLTAFVGSDSVTSAITDGRAISLLSSRYYLKAFGLYTVVVVGFGLASSILPSTKATTIAFPFVVAYVFLGMSAYWGYVYAQAAEKGIVPPPVED